MKVAGFSIIKNAVSYGFPVLESIRSVLPLCDTFYLLLGDSTDETDTFIKSNLSVPQVKLYSSVWGIRKGSHGEHVIAEETDKIFQKIPQDYDWAFYIQADECIHEKDYETIRNAMTAYRDNPQVDGLLFHYYHFFGNYDHLATTSDWYAHEIRVIKNRKDFYSYPDGQGFRKEKNKKLRVKRIDAHIYHYGWAREIEKLRKKRAYQHTLYFSDDLDTTNYEYDTIYHNLKPFTGTHPAIMQERIARENDTNFVYDAQNATIPFKHRFKAFCKKWLRLDIGIYKNYRIV